MLTAHPSQVRVAARNGRPGENEMAMELEHAVEGPGSTRLLFAGGFRAEIQRTEWEALRPAREFVVEIPAGALRILKR